VPLLNVETPIAAIRNNGSPATVSKRKVASSRESGPPRAICLFAGGGGLHLGLHRAGFSTVFATDLRSEAARTFARNFPDVVFHEGDVRRLTPAKVDALVAGHAVDLVAGGPPCQGFSTLGDQRHGDPRNSMFEVFLRIVRWTNPRCVLLENTSYMRSQYQGRFEHEVIASFSNLGYRVSVSTLNAADFGAPQVRKRVFFVGTRESHEFVWPMPTHDAHGAFSRSPWQTVGDAIMDLADVPHAGAPNHLILRHSERVIARYKLTPEGGRMPPPQDLPPEIRRRNFGNTYKRLHRDAPSLTLVPGNNAFPIHPTADRSLSPREAARLQGFPDSYVFEGSRSEQCKLVGNAVPVPLAEALGVALVSHLSGDQRRCSESLTSTLSSPEQTVPTVDDGRVSVLGLPVKRKTQRPSPTAVSLFTGAGGLMLGFMRAGFSILGSADVKAHVAANLSVNFPNLPHEQVDLGQMSPASLSAMIGKARPDVVFGGPPCQGFSIFGNRRFVNTRGSRPEDDARNDLALKYISLAISLDPRVILIENVKGLLSTQHGPRTYMSLIERRLSRAGYAIQSGVVNCADYGVPQMRERLIVIAMKRDVTFEWPAAKFFADPKAWQSGYVTVGDAISDLADESTYGASFSHVPMAHKPLVVERFQLIPEGGRLPESSLPLRLRRGYRTDRVRNFSHVFRRLAMDSPATTMVPGHNAFPVHPFLPRTLTVREAARIQTFPDTMRFLGTRQQQCILVGNAVPPTLGEVFAQAIAKALRGTAALPGYKADHYELKAQM
jgi:DNA (cytosine-5)-methyltransferase 1